MADKVVLLLVLVSATLVALSRGAPPPLPVLSLNPNEFKSYDECVKKATELTNKFDYTDPARFSLYESCNSLLPGYSELLRSVPRSSGSARASIHPLGFYRY